MAWDAGTITSATPWADLSTKLKNLVGGTGVENWSFVENVPAGTGVGQSGATAYSLDVFLCRGAATLYNRIVQVNLGNTGSPTDASSYVSTITTPATNKFITVFVFNTKASAADDPTSVSLDGSNAPTFTKIKSQASGDGNTVLKTTLWIAKTGGSAPTGTQLTVAFGATQTGCGIIVDQWDGPDLTLGATSVDATGATQIGIQVVGGNGTTQTAHSATLATMLGAQSIAVTWAACETTSGTTYSTEAGWPALAANNATVTAPATHSRGMFRTYQDDLTGVLTNSGTITAWSCIALEFQRTTAATSVTSPNDAGMDWYFVIEIPASDGAVTSSFNSAEDYDGNKMFNRMPPTPASAAAVGSGWRSDTLSQYSNYTGNNRGAMAHQVLNTSGFNYWIKLTKNAVTFSTRVSTSEAFNAAMLLDSIITSTTDLPLINVGVAGASANSMSRVAGVSGVTFGTGTGWQCDTYPWTTPTRQGIGTNAASSQDLWASNKIHVARIFVGHSAGNTSANSFLYGYGKGLWKTDFLCFTRGGTVQLGDTMTIGGNTWTVINNSATVLGTGAALIIVTRAN